MITYKLLYGKWGKFVGNNYCDAFSLGFYISFIITSIVIQITFFANLKFQQYDLTHTQLIFNMKLCAHHT